MEKLPPLDTTELVDRIRLAARQANGGLRRVSAESIARGELPPAPEPLPPPPLPPRSVAKADPHAAFEFPLQEAAGMLPRARQKITVDRSIPAMLRPLFRNQGGFNNILLEALTRLVDVNGRLQRQNQELYEGLMELRGWLDFAARKSSADHDWMLAVENRLRGITEARLSALEERLDQRENRRSDEKNEEVLPEMGSSDVH